MYKLAHSLSQSRSRLTVSAAAGLPRDRKKVEDSCRFEVDEFVEQFEGIQRVAHDRQEMTKNASIPNLSAG